MTDSSSVPASTPSNVPKKITRALLSVTDKTGLLEFARALASFDVELVSTGGTAKALRDAGLTVRDISELTGFPEMLDGRVKTLHPVVHGGLLHRRDVPEHVAAVQEHGIPPIDMVVVNLYAFEQTAAKPGVALADLIENIDIGGPSMLRSAAKNFEDVAVVTRAIDYPSLTVELHANSGALSRETRWNLAPRRLRHHRRLRLRDRHRPRSPQPRNGSRSGLRTRSRRRLSVDPAPLRPAQNHPPLRRKSPPEGRRLRRRLRSGHSRSRAVGRQGAQLQQPRRSGRLLESRLRVRRSSRRDHQAHQPLRRRPGATVAAAYARALAGDPVSAFGGVIGVNRPIDAPAATEMAKLFVEAIVAPDFTPEALAILQAKKNLRLLRIQPAPASRVLKQISGGFLLQDEDRAVVDSGTVTVASQRNPRRTS